MTDPGVIAAAALLALAVAGAAQEPAAGRLGGAATVDDAGVNAFSHPSPLLSAVERRAFQVGNSFFKQNWITAPASTPGRDGLGPLFNARSCSACHLKDGRSQPPETGQRDRFGLLIRIGVPQAHGADLPHAVYGGQLQDAAIEGVPPEAQYTIAHEVVRGSYGDGEPFELLRPHYRIVDPAYGPLGTPLALSPRVAPQLIGLGLLEAIAEDVITAWTDPDDRDGDGISGRAHHVEAGGARVLGRFGWKAAQPTVRSQSAAAFANDIGITTSLEPREPWPAGLARDVAAAAAAPELDDHKLDRVELYMQGLAVPAQRDPLAPTVVAGSALFDRFGCAQCHRREMTTGGAGHARFAGQTVQPFTDLLLHDLGDGLADGKRDGDAGPREWRTPPLWGIGLVPIVNGHTRYLHDGRARDLAEAVLWHGGEAEAARERFRTAAAAEREALLAFLRSL